MTSYKLTEDYCNNIIRVFSEEETMESYVSNDRAYKRFIISNHLNRVNKYQWLWNDINNIIKQNLGKEYFLTLWIIVLKYSKDDYFSTHKDRVRQDDDRCMSGGIELSGKNDFEGGNFIVKNVPVEFERGKLLTHKLTDSHEITKLENGARWSLHFGINKEKSKL